MKFYIIKKSFVYLNSFSGVILDIPFKFYLSKIAKNNSRFNLITFERKNIMTILKRKIFCFKSQT